MTNEELKDNIRSWTFGDSPLARMHRDCIKCIEQLEQTVHQLEYGKYGRRELIEKVSQLENDSRLLKEQIRVADIAYQSLFERHQVLLERYKVNGASAKRSVENKNEI